jgi:hypothetical protein
MSGSRSRDEHAPGLLGLPQFHVTATEPVPGFRVGCALHDEQAKNVARGRDRAGIEQVDANAVQRRKVQRHTARSKDCI